jgi:hypothetical protein
MKNFLEFLIKKDVVNHQQVINACVAQEKRTSGVIEMLSEGQLLSTENISGLILKSMESGEHIYSLILAHDKSIAEKLVDEIQTNNPSLASIFVEQGVCDREHLAQLYKEFEEQSSETPKGKDSDDDSSSDTASSGGLSAAALESLRELGMDTSELEGAEAPTERSSTPEVKPEAKTVEEEEKHDLHYLSFFDKPKRDGVSKLIQSIHDEASNGGDYQNLLSSLFKEFHQLKGASRLDELRLSEKMIHQSEELISYIIESGDQGGNLFLKFKNSIEHAFSTIWDLRQMIVDKGDEIYYWKHEKSKSNFIECMKGLKYQSAAA